MRRFWFDGDAQFATIGTLSGGERRRLQLLLTLIEQPNVLLLDEPTNDLDIPTLEVLEESLLEYRGALVLVTHDRYMLDRVSTVVLGLDGMGGAERFADYSQWEGWQRSQLAAGKSNRSVETQSPSESANAAKESLTKKKLSYKEARELGTIEQRIADAERELQAKHDVLLDVGVMSDGERLRAVSLEMEAAQKTIDQLYARWAELEQKTN